MKGVFLWLRAARSLSKTGSVYSILRTSRHELLLIVMTCAMPSSGMLTGNREERREEVPVLGRNGYRWTSTADRCVAGLVSSCSIDKFRISDPLSRDGCVIALDNHEWLPCFAIDFTNEKGMRW